MGLLDWLFGRRDVAPNEDDRLPPMNLPNHSNRRGGKAEVPHVTGDGIFAFDVVGESGYQTNLEIIAGGKTDENREIQCVAYLVPEPSNPHDRNAVRVEINGMTVGYVPRREAAGIKRAIGNASNAGRVSVDALIVGGWKRRNGNEGSFGVKLDIE